MSDSRNIIRAKIKDAITLDDHNANKGTIRGMKLLDDSLRKHGAGRSILLDRKGRAIAGNKTTQTAVDIGLEDVIIVKTNGRQLVAVQREDLDLDDPATGARELAYLDNRVGQLDLDWDPLQLVADLEAGLNFDDLWTGEEISKILDEAGELLSRESTQAANDPNEEWKGMPGFENEPKAQRTLYIHFRDNESIEKFSELIGQDITDKTKSLWYPYKPDNLHMNKDLVYISES